MGERLEAIREKLRELWPYLAGVVFLLVAGAALIYLPERAVPKKAYWLDTKSIFDMKNEARRTIAYIIGGLLAVIGIILTFRRIRALELQVQIAQEEQITERFTRAIDQLGSKEMAIRLGGIYALERIANDSDKDYWPIMETLTAYVRERAPWRESDQDLSTGAVGESGGWAESIARGYLLVQDAQNQSLQQDKPTPLPGPTPCKDIQAILTVLGRRKYHFGQGETKVLDLTGTDLRSANLDGSHLEGAFFIYTNLEHAFLWGAHLEKAIFINANLKDAILNKTHLEGANMKEATGLTQEQLAVAILDGKTKLPEYLKKHPNKGQGPEGKNKT